MAKTYLRVTGSDTFKWVNEPQDATADAKESAQVTLEKLKGAKLERAPEKHPNHDAGWIISSEV